MIELKRFTLDVRYILHHILYSCLQTSLTFPHNALMASCSDGILKAEGMKYIQHYLFIFYLINKDLKWICNIVPEHKFTWCETVTFLSTSIYL